MRVVKTKSRSPAAANPKRDFMRARVVTLAIAAFVVGGALVSPASAATPRKFKNCTEMHKVYPGGIARPGARNRGGVTHKRPYVNAAAFAANHTLDRDRDGIACEA
jgi:hypothetical protein